MHKLACRHSPVPVTQLAAKVSEPKPKNFGTETCCRCEVGFSDILGRSTLGNEKDMETLPDCRNRRIWARRPLEVVGCFHQGADSSLPLPILCRRRPQTVHDPRACKSSQTTQRQHHSKTTYNNRSKTAPKKIPRPQRATPRPIETTLRTAPEDRIEHAHTFQDHSEITTSVGPATSAARGRGL